MKNIRRYLVLAAVLCLFLFVKTESRAATIQYSYGDSYKVYKGKTYKLYCNNRLVNSYEFPALSINGCYMAAYEFSLVDRGPGFKSCFVPATQCINLLYGNKQIKMYVGRKEIYINNVKKRLSVAPCIVKNGNTMYYAIPIRQVLNGFGLKFTTSDAQRCIRMTCPIRKTADDASDVLTMGNFQATVFKGMSTSRFIEKMGPIARADYRKTKILASVTLAQAILESGWGRSGLTQRSNNMFGIKASASGNNWKGSTWTGRSVSVYTRENYGGNTVTVRARFRSYGTVGKSIVDHSAYLCNAMNGSRKRYAGITATKSYQRQLAIIMNGGYCTGTSYYNQLCSIITHYNLTKWDR